jgi:hypothetical protein
MSKKEVTYNYCKNITWTTSKNRFLVEEIVGFVFILMDLTRTFYAVLATEGKVRLRLGFSEFLGCG